MAQDRFPAETVRAFLQRQRVATLDDLKQALGTTGTMTVFRKLKSLLYLSSYSHQGKYYTLQEIPAFDEQGLWGWHSVWFSRYGNLVETSREFVEAAAAGFTAGELETILHVVYAAEVEVIGLVFGERHFVAGDEERRRRAAFRRLHLDEFLITADRVGPDVVSSPVSLFLGYVTHLLRQV